MDLLITVKSRRGTRPAVYRVGKPIVLREGHRLDLQESDAAFLHSFASVRPYHNAVARGVAPEDLGLADEGGNACVQYLDPCEETGGGTVIFSLAPLAQKRR